MDHLDNKFRYVYSSSLNYRVPIKIGTLEGLKDKPPHDKLLNEPLLRFSGLYSEQCPSLMVRLQVYNKGEPYGLPVTTSYKSFTKRWNWNEWVQLPLQFNDLPRTAMLALTILDCAGAGQTSIIGGTTISLFGKYGLFRQGMFDLRVWIDVEADGNTATKTPGKCKDSNKNQMQRLAKLAKKHRNGQIPQVDWLDRLTFREIEVINKKEKTESDYLYLLIEFPTIISGDHTYSIIYYEPDGNQKYTFISKPKLVTVPDSEISQDNLVERKHHRLARSARSGLSDRDAKPTASVRDHLHTIVYRYPPTATLTSEDQDLVWKFRFYLSTQKKALTKFLKCINWGTSTEVKQALTLLLQWAPMDVEDALELLSPSFTHPVVRRYAITRLKQAPDDDLLLYLLQLVQALKYEDFNNIDEAFKQITPDSEVIKSIDENETNSFTTESDGELNGNVKSSNIPTQAQDEQFSASSIITPTNVSVVNVDNIKTINDNNNNNNNNGENDIDNNNNDNNSNNNNNNNNSNNSNNNKNNNNNSNSMADLSNTLIFDNLNNAIPSCDLTTFLIQRACQNSTLANYFYWYLYIECENQESVRKQDERVQNMYEKVLKIFKRTLTIGSTQLKQIKTNLDKQQVFIDELVKLVRCVAKESGNRKKKCEKFQQLLSDTDTFRVNFANFEPIPLPLDPNVWIKGILPQKVSLFKSALMPSKLTFVTTTNNEYVAIFKYGDDLRQDQLILQMITLMDKLLRRENLDLKLTPYHVLATSSKHGFLQYIDAITVAEVLATEGSIHNFFRKHHPCETGPYGISADIMDTYIRSCAGYCVITYLLGVGDRHLDNLLLTTSGKLFHIDFGYILGRDPKPMPPPMKLSKEMVEAMGGVTSEHHHEFRKQCYTSFLHLRRHANVMLNLFSLMVDASVPDIALEPDKAVKKVEENLKLSLTDEEAVQHLQGLLDLSITAVMPALVEQIHKLAQYWRK